MLVDSIMVLPFPTSGKTFKCWRSLGGKLGLFSWNVNDDSSIKSNLQKSNENISKRIGVDI
jgi:hypothetical protein